MDEEIKERYQEDLNYFTKKVQDAPDSKLFLPLAVACLKLGKFDDVIYYCAEGLERYPDMIAAKTVMAQAYKSIGKSEEAKGLLIQVTLASPDNYQAARMLGDIYFKEKEIEKALTNYENAYRVSPEDIDLKETIDKLKEQIAGGAEALIVDREEEVLNNLANELAEEVKSELTEEESPEDDADLEDGEVDETVDQIVAGEGYGEKDEFDELDDLSSDEELGMEEELSEELLADSSETIELQTEEELEKGGDSEDAMLEEMGIDSVIVAGEGADNAEIDEEKEPDFEDVFADEESPAEEQAEQITEDLIDDDVVVQEPVSESEADQTSEDIINEALAAEISEETAEETEEEVPIEQSISFEDEDVQEAAEEMQEDEDPVAAAMQEMIEENEETPDEDEEEKTPIEEAENEEVQEEAVLPEPEQEEIVPEKPVEETSEENIEEAEEVQPEEQNIQEVSDADEIDDDLEELDDFEELEDLDDFEDFEEIEDDEDESEDIAFEEHEEIPEIEAEPEPVISEGAEQEEAASAETIEEPAEEIEEEAEEAQQAEEPEVSVQEEIEEKEADEIIEEQVEKTDDEAVEEAAEETEPEPEAIEDNKQDAEEEQETEPEIISEKSVNEAEVDETAEDETLMPEDVVAAVAETEKADEIEKDILENALDMATDSEVYEQEKTDIQEEIAPLIDEESAEDISHADDIVSSLKGDSSQEEEKDALDAMLDESPELTSEADSTEGGSEFSFDEADAMFEDEAQPVEDEEISEDFDVTSVLGRNEDDDSFELPDDGGDMLEQALKASQDSEIEEAEQEDLPEEEDQKDETLVSGLADELAEGFQDEGLEVSVLDAAGEEDVVVKALEDEHADQLSLGEGETFPPAQVSEEELNLNLEDNEFDNDISEFTDENVNNENYVQDTDDLSDESMEAETTDDAGFSEPIDKDSLKNILGEDEQEKENKPADEYDDELSTFLSSIPDTPNIGYGDANDIPDSEGIGHVDKDIAAILSGNPTGQNIAEDLLHEDIEPEPSDISQVEEIEETPEFDMPEDELEKLLSSPPSGQEAAENVIDDIFLGMDEEEETDPDVQEMVSDIEMPTADEFSDEVEQEEHRQKVLGELLEEVTRKTEEKLQAEEEMRMAEAQEKQEQIDRLEGLLDKIKKGRNE